MTAAETDHAADLQRNEPNEAHAARLAAGLKAHAASMRRNRVNFERLRCSWFIFKYGPNWREEMKRAADRG